MQSKAKTVRECLAGLPEERRAAIQAIARVPAKSYVGYCESVIKASGKRKKA